MTIVVTGSRRATEQSALVSNFGGSPYVVPTVGISLPADDEEVEPFLRALTAGDDPVDYAVFMTATGVRSMMLAAERLGSKSGVQEALNRRETMVVARSSKPAGELRKLGVKVDASPPRDEATASGILRLLQERGVAGKRVAILWHGSKNEVLREGILAAGGREVFEGLTYHYSTVLEQRGADVLGSIGFRYEAPEEGAVVRLIHELVEGTRKIEAITFTSPPAAAGLFEVAAEHGLEEPLRRALATGHPEDLEGEGDDDDRVLVVSVGPSTSRELGELGVRVDVEPDVAAMGAMMSALAEHVKTRRTKRSDGNRDGKVVAVGQGDGEEDAEAAVRKWAAEASAKGGGSGSGTPEDR